MMKYYELQNKVMVELPAEISAAKLYTDEMIEQNLTSYDSEVDIKIADATADYYTKTEVNTEITNAIADIDIPEVDLSNYYTIAEINELYYTKAEINDLLTGIQVADLSGTEGLNYE